MLSPINLGQEIGKASLFPTGYFSVLFIRILTEALTCTD